MAMSTGGGKQAVPYINVTPLIDVLLVVIIIFMVVTPLKPSRFKADIPTQRDPNENIQNLKAGIRSPWWFRLRPICKSSSTRPDGFS